MQHRAWLLLCGCLWLVACSVPATTASDQPHSHHRSTRLHAAADGVTESQQRRADLHEVPERSSEDQDELTGDESSEPAEPALPESSHHCWHEGTAEEENKFHDLGANSSHTVCSYRNIYLWNGQVFYVANNRFYLPRVRMAYEDVAWQETLNVKIAPLKRLPVDWPSRPSEEWPAVAFWYPSHFAAFDQLFGEHGPNLHILACTVLGLCEHTEEQQEALRILFTNTHDAARIWDWPSQINEMWACFSKHRPLVLQELRNASRPASARQSKRHKATMRSLLASVLGEDEEPEEEGELEEEKSTAPSGMWTTPPDMRNKLILIKHAAAGVGPECRSRKFCQPEFGAERPAPDLMKSWKKRVSSCFKVPEDSEVKTSSPLIGVVDYLAFTPRSLANAESLMLHLQTRLEGHDARLQYFPLGRTASMEDIAAVYSSIDILVQVAGDRAANLVFLPKGAAVVDIATHGYPETSTWTIRTARDLPFQWLGYVPVLDQRHKLLSITEAGPGYMGLTPDQQTAVRLSQCPTIELQLRCHEMWWFGSQVEVIVPQLDEAVSTALTTIGQAAL